MKSKTLAIAAIVLAVLLVAAGKYSKCVDEGFWWGVQHTAGNQCWSWQRW